MVLDLRSIDYKFKSRAVECNPEQFVYPHAPLSPNIHVIIWHRLDLYKLILILYILDRTIRLYWTGLTLLNGFSFLVIFLFFILGRAID